MKFYHIEVNEHRIIVKHSEESESNCHENTSGSWDFWNIVVHMSRTSSGVSAHRNIVMTGKASQGNASQWGKSWNSFVSFLYIYLTWCSPLTSLTACDIKNSVLESLLWGLTTMDIHLNNSQKCYDIIKLQDNTWVTQIDVTKSSPLRPNIVITTTTTILWFDNNIHIIDVMNYIE